MAVVSPSVVMETVPFAMRHMIGPHDLTIDLLENLIKDIVRKAMKFGLIDYDKALGIESASKELARRIIDTLREKLQHFCSVKSMRTPKIAVMKKTLEISIGKISMKFVFVDDGESCGIRLIELR